jgi:hypothetical protein
MPNASSTAGIWIKQQLTRGAYNPQEERFRGTWKMLYFNDRKLKARISSMSTYMKKIFVLASSKLQKF